MRKFFQKLLVGLSLTTASVANTESTVINPVTPADAATIKHGLTALGQFQTKLDGETWQITDPMLAKVRHINLHLSKVNGSLAGIVEKWDHAAADNTSSASDAEMLQPEVLQDIIADLMMHAAQLSNVLGVSMYDAYTRRVNSNLKRFAPESKLALQ